MSDELNKQKEFCFHENNLGHLVAERLGCLLSWASDFSILYACVCVCLICVLVCRYVGNLQRIFDYSPLDPSQDFATQM